MDKIWSKKENQILKQIKEFSAGFQSFFGCFTALVFQLEFGETLDSYGYRIITLV